MRTVNARQGRPGWGKKFPDLEEEVVHEDHLDQGQQAH